MTNSELSEKVANIIANNIFVLRRNAKLTQTQLGTLCGVSKVTIINWESAYTTPKVPNIAALCIVFNIDPNRLFDWPLT